jgi:hypothetical protein
MNASALMSSQSGWFVPAKEMASTEQDERKENQISFNSMVSAMYLNTKHNHMESFIEPYPTFGKVTYQVLADGADNKGMSCVYFNFQLFDHTLLPLSYQRVIISLSTSDILLDTS